MIARYLQGGSPVKGIAGCSAAARAGTFNSVFARALFAGRAGDAPHQTIKEQLNEIRGFRRVPS
jgi:hypothetical protein